MLLKQTRQSRTENLNITIKFLLRFWLKGEETVGLSGYLSKLSSAMNEEDKPKLFIC